MHYKKQKVNALTTANRLMPSAVVRIYIYIAMNKRKTGAYSKHGMII